MLASAALAEVVDHGDLADVADEAQVLRMFEQVDAGLGRLTALVNNAGVVDRTQRVDAMSERDRERSDSVTAIEDECVVAIDLAADH